MRPNPWAVVVGGFALLGFVFAAVSTHDFAAHLDRQVHGIHCSFLPGVTEPDISGASGCHATLMSPYSSILRGRIWGGIPVSLPAMSVFAFIFFWAMHLVLTRRQQDKRATGFLLAATAVPLSTSLVMGVLSFWVLDAVCKLCIGIYVASLGVFVGAAGWWWQAKRAAVEPRERRAEPKPRGPDADMPFPEERPRSNRYRSAAPETSWGALAGAFGVGVLFVLLPVTVYAAIAPDYSRYVGACGTLPEPEDPHDVLLPLGDGRSGLRMVEVLDPLCSACKGFEQRFDAWAQEASVQRELLLFPLDDRCNWMVDRAIHPGACTVSEAMLCAGDEAEAVLGWAFDHQEDIRQAAEADPEAARDMVLQAFPHLGGCLDKPAVKAKLNRALRWAVDNQLPVLTPQVYVNGTRLCDEDTDLGMEYALSRLIARGGRPIEKEPAP